MKKYKNTMKALMAMSLLIIAVTATTTAQTVQTVQTDSLSGRSITYGNTSVDYADSYRVVGRRHDQLVMVGEKDSTTGKAEVYWKARTIDGFYLGGFAGVNFDFGQSCRAVGYAVYAEAGYTGKWVDLAVSAGYSRLANPFVEGEKYGAWSAFFEPAFVPVRWNKKSEINRFYFGAMLGLQQAKSSKYFTYEDDYVILEEEGNAKSFGLALGGKIGYEWRMYMGGLRVGVEARVYTYNSESSFSVESNGVQTANEVHKTRRWQAQLGLTMKGVFGRTARSWTKK